VGFYIKISGGKKKVVYVGFKKEVVKPSKLSSRVFLEKFNLTFVVGRPPWGEIKTPPRKERKNGFKSANLFKTLWDKKDSKRFPLCQKF